MPNTYFQFKQFRIEQEKSSMKVCTDSCLFGAWIQLDDNTKSILDIGTGTGLLSLMLAQKSNAEIHGIEIDNASYLQTKENFENSCWKDRLKACNGDVKNYAFSQTFDFIVCNPPFYENEVESNTQGEKIAKHSLHLSFSDVVIAIENLLTQNGKFAILLPYYRKDEFENLASKHLFYPEKTIFLSQTTEHNFFRYAAIFSRNKNLEKQHEEVVIRIKDNTYSEEVTALLKPYYLYM